MLRPMTARTTPARRAVSQGGSISPLLANIYLRYVFDLWAQQWRKRQAHSDVVVVRFADDSVVDFEHRHEAEQFLAELRERFAKFGLELHPDKRYASLSVSGGYSQSVTDANTQTVNHARKPRRSPRTA
jgi:retron-type reverse transcriptase